MRAGWIPRTGHQLCRVGANSSTLGAEFLEVYGKTHRYVTSSRSAMFATIVWLKAVMMACWSAMVKGTKRGPAPNKNRMATAGRHLSICRAHVGNGEGAAYQRGACMSRHTTQGGWHCISQTAAAYEREGAATMDWWCLCLARPISACKSSGPRVQSSHKAGTQAPLCRSVKVPNQNSMPVDVAHRQTTHYTTLSCGAVPPGRRQLRTHLAALGGTLSRAAASSGVSTAADPTCPSCSCCLKARDARAGGAKAASRQARRASVTPMSLQQPRQKVMPRTSFANNRLYA